MIIRPNGEWDKDELLRRFPPDTLPLCHALLTKALEDEPCPRATLKVQQARAGRRLPRLVLTRCKGRYCEPCRAWKDFGWMACYREWFSAAASLHVAASSRKRRRGSQETRLDNDTRNLSGAGANWSSVSHEDGSAVIVSSGTCATVRSRPVGLEEALETMVGWLRGPLWATCTSGKKNSRPHPLRNGGQWQRDDWCPQAPADDTLAVVSPSLLRDLTAALSSCGVLAPRPARHTDGGTSIGFTSSPSASLEAITLAVARAVSLAAPAPPQAP